MEAELSKKFGLSSFSTFVSNDFYRPYKFYVNIDNDFKCEWVATTMTPSETTSIQYIDWMHSRVPLAGRTVTNQWKVFIRDTVDGPRSFIYFNRWKSQVFYGKKNVPNSSFNAQIPFKYKRTIEVILVSPDGGVRRGFRLWGAFPFQIGEITLSPDENNISIFSVDFVFDYIESLYWTRNY